MRVGKIISTTVEQVHYHKNLGVAEITPESAKRFCATWYPDKYDSMAEYVTARPEMVYLDFEDILTGMEAADHYASLMRVAKLGDFRSAEDKGFLICALMIHAMRGYEYMSAAIERTNGVGIDKWEYFWLLKNAWSSQAFLARAVTVPAFAEWTLWRMPQHTFPLCDSPVMMDFDSVMAPLSPRLLLEINLNVRRPEQYWRLREDLPKHKLAEFQRRSIANTFKEIIFHDSQVLQEWLTSEHAAARIELLSDPSKTQDCVQRAASRVSYGLNGFGRLK
jgi:hypothetical protein